MKLIKALIFSFMALSTMACSKDSNNDDGGQQEKPAVAQFTIKPSSVIVDNFAGFGTQYNNNLYTPLTASSDGVTDANIAQLETKVKNLKSQYVRIFFTRKAWEGYAGYDASYMPSFIKTVELANSTGALINITYWHTTLSEDMPKFAEVIKDLVVTRNLTNIKQVTIQNEVNDTQITQADYNAAYSVFKDELVRMGIRDRIKIVAGDLTLTNQASWFNYMAANMSSYVDGYSSHIYYDHWDEAKPVERQTGIIGELDKMTAAQRKPIYITEYGIRGVQNAGDPYKNPGLWQGTNKPVSWTVGYAFMHALFNINAMNNGFAGLIKWDCYKAKYDNGNQYHSLIGPGSAGYPLYPSYFQTALFTLTSASGWKTVEATRLTAASNAQYVAAMTDATGANMTIYALTRNVRRESLTINGLTPKKSFHLYAWNDDLMGGLVKKADVKTDDKGELTVEINANSVIAITTMNPDISQLK